MRQGVRIRFTLRVPVHLHRALIAVAAQRRCTLNALIITALIEWLQTAGGAANSTEATRDVGYRHGLTVYDDDGERVGTI